MRKALGSKTFRVFWATSHDIQASEMPSRAGTCHFLSARGRSQHAYRDTRSLSSAAEVQTNRTWVAFSWLRDVARRATRGNTRQMHWHIRCILRRSMAGSSDDE